MTDDDIRHMLHSKAAEVQVSDDAWDKIAARLDERPVARTVGRRLALVGAAAAAVAGTVVVANLPGTSQVAGPETTTTAEVTAAVEDRAAINQAVSAWLTGVLPGNDRAVPTETELVGADEARVRMLTDELATEVWLQRLSGRPGWAVVTAASDLLLLDNPTYDVTDGLVAGGSAEVDGELTVTYVVNGTEVVDGGARPVQAREPIAIGHPGFPGAESVTVRLVLRADDGTVAVAQQDADMRADAALPQGSIVAVFPAVDSAGLATLQEDADAGRRDDLLAPQAVAGQFLGELLPRNETPTSYTVGEFQRGDNTSGEVPYTLSDGSSGVILVRTTGAPGAIWFVAGATSDDVDIVTVRREETHLVADVRSDRSGTLTWTGATSVELKAGQIVSIGRPDVPLGAYPVVVRLMDGDRTLAIAARLG